MALTEWNYKFDGPEDKLVKARCRLMTQEPFYGAMAVQMDWISSERVPTMGVRILSNGRVECLFNPKFVEEEPFFSIYATIQHEIEHVIRLHCIRCDTRLPELWNIAADMTINGTDANPRIGFKENGQGRPILPFEHNERLKAEHPDVKIVFIPQGWDEKSSSEEFYDKLIQDAKVKGQPQKGKGKKGQQGQNPNGSGGQGQQDPNGQQGNGDGEGQGDGDQEGEGGGSGNGQNPGGFEVQYSNYGAMIGDHSVWNDSDVSPDEARGIVKHMVQEAVNQNPGKVPGHLQEAIQKLNKPIVRWNQLLRMYMGQHIGNQRKTFSRMNRRRPVFGNPGISRHAAASITCIIDTSGSICSEMLEQYFGEIEAMAHRAKISVLQWDHAFQGYDPRYRKHGWKKFQVNGRGGTDMVAPYEWLKKNRLVGDVVILLTDGYTPWPTKQPFPCIFCITTDTPGPGWGHEIRLK